MFICLLVKEFLPLCPPPFMDCSKGPHLDVGYPLLELGPVEPSTGGRVPAEGATMAAYSEASRSSLVGGVYSVTSGSLWCFGLLIAPVAWL